MRRTRYLLTDTSGLVRATILANGEGEPEVEPWMLHAVNERGWALAESTVQESGVTPHGYADWAGVADSLAAVVRTIMGYSERTDRPPSHEEDEALLEAAQSALDDYDLAMMESNLGSPAGPSPDDEAPPEDDDGPGD